MAAATDPELGPPELGAPTEWFELPSGNGRVELERVITYGTRRRAVLALAHHKQRVDIALRLQADGELVCAMVRTYVGLDPAAVAPRSPLTLADIDSWPAGDVDAVFRRAAHLFREGTRKPDPKAGPS